MRKHQRSIDPPDSDKITWLANQIFTAFPEEVTRLKFYILDCGCIYYQRGFRDGGLDPQIGIYRNAEDGPCELCMLHEEICKERAVDKIKVFNSKFKITAGTREEANSLERQGSSCSPASSTVVWHPPPTLPWLRDRSTIPSSPTPRGKNIRQRESLSYQLKLSKLKRKQIKQ